MPSSTTDKKHTTHNAKDATICKNADRSYKMKKTTTDQLAPVYNMPQSTVNSQQIEQSTNQDDRVYRCKKSMKMQQSTANSQQMKQIPQSTAAKKMPQSMKILTNATAKI